MLGRRLGLGVLAFPLVIASATTTFAKTGIVGREEHPSKRWGGPGCPAVGSLRSLIDNYLATPDPNVRHGPNIPGASLSISHAACGALSYAAGWSKIEQKELLTPATRMQIASMTKAIIAAVTLQLSEAGAFGPRGLDTSAKDLLTPAQIQSLTAGDDPTHPRCPGHTYLFNRDTGEFDWTAFSCPDLSRVTLRDLMRANHGMYDFFNEVLLPEGFSQTDEAIFFDLYQYLGLNPIRPPSPGNGFDVLKAYGLKQSDSAVIGGSNRRDFEVSWGNTGFQLLGIILEQTTGETLDQLIRRLVVTPLGLDSIEMYLDPARQGSQTADGYVIVNGFSTPPGSPTVEQTGVYPVVDVQGNTEVNTLSLGLGKPGNYNTGGGSGGLNANPSSYRVFLQAFVNGGLLGPVAQTELRNSFILLPWFSSFGITYYNGFGLLKNQIRNFGGADRDTYWHYGSIVGAMCDDELVNAPDSNDLMFTIVVCQNARGLRGTEYPRLDDLLNEFFSTLFTAPR